MTSGLSVAEWTRRMMEAGAGVKSPAKRNCPARSIWNVSPAVQEAMSAAFCTVSSESEGLAMTQALSAGVRLVFQMRTIDTPVI